MTQYTKERIQAALDDFEDFIKNSVTSKTWVSAHGFLQKLYTIRSLLTQAIEQKTVGCECCSDTGQIELYPGATVYHPCDTCRPDDCKVWMDGYNTQKPCTNDPDTHDWTGPWVELDRGGSVSCAKCGMLAISHSMRYAK